MIGLSKNWFKKVGSFQLTVSSSQLKIEKLKFKMYSVINEVDLA